ncbi:SDR family oxidoreductase [Streptomyces sp. NPDC092903]|uniref:SDR family oxidoreductase n=1 Tax=Streptomyces sp. NPDC092903 TaxID=3366017 RepID=UPI0038131AF5
MARELGSRGITFNVVGPGLTETSMEPAAQRRAAREPQDPDSPGPPRQAEEIAATVAFLVSEHAAYITGAVVPVDGGAGMGPLISRDCRLPPAVPLAIRT